MRIEECDDRQYYSIGRDEFMTVLKGQDAAVLLLHSNDISIHNNIIDASMMEGLKRVIRSEFGDDSSNNKVVEQVPILKGKQHITKIL